MSTSVSWNDTETFSKLIMAPGRLSKAVITRRAREPQSKVDSQHGDSKMTGQSGELPQRMLIFYSA